MKDLLATAETIENSAQISAEINRAMELVRRDYKYRAARSEQELAKVILNA
jgi:type II secretory pathway component PulJ